MERTPSFLQLTSILLFLRTFPLESNMNLLELKRINSSDSDELTLRDLRCVRMSSRFRHKIVLKWVTYYDQKAFHSQFITN